MRSWFYRKMARATGKNLKSTPEEILKEQMLEPRPLPMGRKDFDIWAHRIISGALLPLGKEEDKEIFIQSQKFTLANLIMHLGPTESHKPDFFFIHSLRKLAANQVADAVRTEIRDDAKARLSAKEELEKMANQPPAPAEQREAQAVN